MAASRSRHARSSQSDTWPVRSQSHLTVSSVRVSGKFGMASRRLLPATPLTLSAAATSASMEPCSASHLTAVLGPTLFTPGTLSTVSPTSIR
ncbi:Uncharacterised protein [Bordetella pertussis]|nr:Uncharacterised protein [Bordetella pertussis]